MRYATTYDAKAHYQKVRVGSKRQNLMLEYYITAKYTWDRVRAKVNDDGQFDI